MGEQPTAARGLDTSDLVQLGEIVSTHGIRGLLRLRLFNPRSRALDETNEVFLSSDGASFEKHELVSTGRCRNFLLIKLSGAIDHESARLFVGARVFVRKASLPALGHREYYHYQLENLSVVSSQGREIGRVRQVLPTPANDVLVVSGDGTEYMIPLVEEIVPEIDLLRGRIRVADIAGLLE